MSKKSLDAMNLKDKESVPLELLHDFNENYVGCDVEKNRGGVIASAIHVLVNIYDVEDTDTFINAVANYTEVIAIFFIDDFYEHKDVPFDYLGTPAFNEFLVSLSESFINTVRKSSVLCDIYKTVLGM